MTSKDTSHLLDMAANRKQYYGMRDLATTPAENGKKLDQTNTTPFSIHISQFQIAIIISVATMLATVCNIIMLPIYLTDLVGAGSDPFVASLTFRLSCLFAFFLAIVIQWCYTRELPLLRPNTRYMAAALVGFLSALNGIMGVFGSLPDRTRPELLGVLSAAILPNTVICRYAILRKAVSGKRLLCATIVVFGLFVSLIPDIFKLLSEDEIYISDMNGDQGHHTYPQRVSNGTNDTLLQHDTAAVYNWVWPLVVVGRTLPWALLYVIIEREIKSPEVSFVTFVFWTEFVNCVSLVALFWTALIPNVGMFHDVNDLLTALKRGLHCSISADPSCHGMLIPSLIYILNSPCMHAFSIILTKYAEGAIYTVLIMSACQPASALFWTLFVDTDLDGLLWRAQFNIFTIFTFAGILIIIPATYLYAYLSNSKEGDSNDTLKETLET